MIEHFNAVRDCDYRTLPMSVSPATSSLSVVFGFLYYKWCLTGFFTNSYAFKAVMGEVRSVRSVWRFLCLLFQCWHSCKANKPNEAVLT